MGNSTASKPIVRTPVLDQGIQNQHLNSHSMKDYLAHQSRKTQSLFDEDADACTNACAEWQAMAHSLAASRQRLQQALASAHAAQLDDFDAPEVISFTRH